MVTYSEKVDLEGFKMGQKVGLLHPPVGRRFFFSKKFSQKYFFLLKNRHMGDFFGRLLWGVIQPPPPLKTRSWEDPGHPPHPVAEI